MSYIVTNNLSKSYARRGKTFYAVENINFSLELGEFVMIEGDSGSGKTTFLNLLFGILNPTEGSVTIEGEQIENRDDESLSKLRREKIKYIPQGDSLLPALTVKENIRFISEISGEIPDDNEIERIALKLGISDLLDEYPSELSGGELRRAAIARALINNPKVILADEPTGCLDEENTCRVMEIFKSIHEEGTALIVVTHQKETLKYATKILRMEKGILAVYGDKHR